MKKFFNNLVGAILIGLALHLLGWGLQAIVSIASPGFGSSPVGRSIGNFFKVGAVIMFLFSLVYPYVKGKVKVKRAWMGQVLLVFGLILWGMLSYQKSKIDLLYYSLKTPSRGWYQQPHMSDPQLGFAPRPGAQGYHTFPDSTFLAMRYDEGGFRVPVEPMPTGAADSALILFLGCSFTYGDAVAAENTFAHLVADSLNFRYHNAGVCSWGLSQMYLRGQELIQELKPDYVVVQYSPWLVERGISHLAPSNSILVPSPYITNVENEVSISAPLFKAYSFDLPLGKYKTTPNSITDYLKFAFRIGWPLQLYSDYHRYRIALGRKVGALPPSLKDKEAVERAVYSSLIETIKAEGGQPILLGISQSENTEALEAMGEQLNLNRVANADARLWEVLPDDSRDTYAEAYFHWKILDGERVVVDRHPNKNAHQLIAETIIEQIITE